MITIDQLTKSAIWNFVPKFVTKDKNGEIFVWNNEPELYGNTWTTVLDNPDPQSFGFLKLAEFEGKDWQDCIYEIEDNDSFINTLISLNLFRPSVLYEIRRERFARRYQ